MCCVILMKKSKVILMKHNETGRSMIEMLGVLAIIGILSVGGMLGYSKTMAQYKINATLEQVELIASKISAYGAGADSYVGLNSSTAMKLRAIPSSAIDGGALMNKYGGAIDIKPSWISSDTKDDQAYAIIFSGLTEDACVALGASAWGNIRNSSFIGLGVGTDAQTTNMEKALYQGCPGGTDAKTYAVACSGGGTLAVPMDAGTAALACECPNSNCSLIMKFF